MTLTPATNKQVPDNAILDRFNKQIYLGNKYGYILNLTAGGTTEVSEIYLANPVSSSSSFPSGKVSLFVDLRMLTPLSSAANNIMRVYLNPTVSVAGTTRTPVNMRPASPNVSVATLESAPTTTASGTLVESLASSTVASQTSSNLIILDPGQSMLITLQTTLAAVANLQIGWYEI